jgi:hypothetical protein
MGICIDSGAEEEEDDVACGNLNPLLEADLTKCGFSHDCVECLWVVYFTPRVRAFYPGGHGNEEEDGVGQVEEDNNEADKKEADEA